MLRGIKVDRLPVLTKRDFVKRYGEGEFGNASPTWGNLEEFLQSGYDGLVHIRNRLAGADTWYDVPTIRVSEVWSEATSRFQPRQLYISAMAPTNKTLFQGEVQQGVNGLDLYYTTVPRPMREALAIWNRQVSGVVALMLLKHYLCQNSWEWLTYLLDAYPGHVVELSTYDVEWGTVSRYNTVFWEVRSY